MSEKIYGRKPVLEAIRSGSRAISRIYLMQGSRDDILHQIESHANARGIPIGFETRHRMDTMAGNGNHQGVIAVADAYQYADLEDIFAAARAKDEPLFTILLDEIEDPQNLGAIIRSADAAGSAPQAGSLAGASGAVTSRAAAPSGIALGAAKVSVPPPTLVICTCACASPSWQSFCDRNTVVVDGIRIG